MTPERRTTIEDLERFRLVWSVEDHWADVKVFEITSHAVDASPLFAKEDDIGIIALVESVDEARPYLTGYVKWDGCAELNQGCPHWCGPDYFKRHCDLLKHIYLRAFELMGLEPEEEWE